MDKRHLLTTMSMIQNVKSKLASAKTEKEKKLLLIQLTHLYKLGKEL